MKWVSKAVLLADIGNTHIHLGYAIDRRIHVIGNLKTLDAMYRKLPKTTILPRSIRCVGAVLCSVVPDATSPVQQWIRMQTGIQPLQLTSATARGIGIDYPKPSTIGPDRLANAIAARLRFGAPAVVVDFGTAVTFDVIRADGCYIGGIIAPGLSVMTDYLHEKTALLPKVKIVEPRSVIGRSTIGAMQVGAVHGYRGLVRELIHKLREELHAPTLPVVATGGYARLMAKGLPEIQAVIPELTLEGLHLHWLSHQESAGT